VALRKSVHARDLQRSYQEFSKIQLMGQEEECIFLKNPEKDSFCLSSQGREQPGGNGTGWRHT
jgi:hypothetical protein